MSEVDSGDGPAVQEPERQRDEEERAQNVADSAQKSREMSTSGQQAIADTIEGMMLLQQQIEDIAETILTLSERTQQIGEIIDTVNAVADQSKLLALNASIEAAKGMNEGGRIVIIGSVNADRMPMAGGAAYALSKSAMQGFVRGLARDLGHKNITVNNIQPGPVDTDMNPEDGPMKDVMHSFMAIKRHVRPEEIAGMVAYLTGAEAGIITGAQHTIDGGFSA